MHRSRLSAVLLDCDVSDLDEAARFWGAALGRPVDRAHPNNDERYLVLSDPPDEVMMLVQRVDHESRAHIDIETDDVPAEVARLEKLGATVHKRFDRHVVMRAPSGQRFCVVNVQRPGFPKNANRWE